MAYDGRKEAYPAGFSRGRNLGFLARPAARADNCFSDSCRLGFDSGTGGSAFGSAVDGSVGLLIVRPFFGDGCGELDVSAMSLASCFRMLSDGSSGLDSTAGDGFSVVSSGTFRVEVVRFISVRQKFRTHPHNRQLVVEHVQHP